MSKAASLSLVEQLHNLLTQTLIDKLNDPESLTSGDLAVIRQFLKDNGVNAVPGEGSPMQKLVKSLEDLPEFGDGHPFN